MGHLLPIPHDPPANGAGGLGAAAGAPYARVVDGPAVGIDSVVVGVPGVVPTDPERALTSFGPERVRRGRHRGRVVHKGYLGNLLVTVVPEAEGGPETVVVGSVAKRAHGTNAVLLTPAEARDVVYEVGDDLGLPHDQLAIGHFWGVDAAADVDVGRPVVDVLSAVVEADGMERVTHGPTSVSFRQKSRRVGLGLYGKVDELRARGEDVPEAWFGREILRAEVRLRARLSERFGGPLFVSDLGTAEFGLRLVQEWKAGVDRLRVAHAPVFPADAKPKELVRFLARLALEPPGAARVLDQISARRAAGLIASGRATRQRRAIRGLLEDEGLNVVSALESELRTAFEACVARSAGLYSEAVP